MKEQNDHELTGTLERVLRRAGAEDVVILVSDGRGRPFRRKGARSVRTPRSWSRSNTTGTGRRSPQLRGCDIESHLSSAAATQLREILSGPYSWENVDDTAAAAVISLQLQIPANDRQFYYGDTCLQSKEGLRVL